MCGANKSHFHQKLNVYQLAVRPGLLTDDDLWEEAITKSVRDDTKRCDEESTVPYTILYRTSWSNNRRKDAAATT